MVDRKEVEFVDTPEEVDRAYRAQLKLAVTYGIVFFVSVLLIPFLSGSAEWWYGKPIWGGFTLNYLVVAVLFHVFYVILGYFYVKQANALEDKLLGGEEEVRKND
ncbi:MAG: hypothetical protein ABDH59_03335 [Fervidobacterium sp.]